jgi:hypothetical protein
MKSLTECLKEVGEEQIQVCINGQHMTVSKTEAVARKMFLLAHGGVEEVTNEDGKVVKLFHKPDYRVAKTIREFIEGKPNQEPPQLKSKGKKAGTFDSKIGKRLNEVTATTKIKLPDRPVISKPVPVKGNKNNG